MYGFYFDFGSLMTVITICLIAALVAWLMAINLFVGIGKSKGYFEDGAGMLWFIGIFATPIVVGLYVAALPDKNAPRAKGEKRPVANDELPSI